MSGWREKLPGFADLHRSIQAALSGTPDHFVRALSSTGPYREAQFSFVPQRAADNSITGCFMVMTDVTELKMLEARLRQAEKMQAIGEQAPYKLRALAQVKRLHPGTEVFGARTLHKGVLFSS